MIIFLLKNNFLQGRCSNQGPGGRALLLRWPGPRGPELQAPPSEASFWKGPTVPFLSIFAFFAYCGLVVEIQPLNF